MTLLIGKVRIKFAPPIPTAQNMNCFRGVINAVKYFETLSHDKTPDPGPLAHVGKTLWKKDWAFGRCNNDLAELSASVGIVESDSPDNSLKIQNKGFAKNYFEFHLLNRAGT